MASSLAKDLTNYFPQLIVNTPLMYQNRVAAKFEGVLIEPTSGNIEDGLALVMSTGQVPGTFEVLVTRLGSDHTTLSPPGYPRQFIISFFYELSRFFKLTLMSATVNGSHARDFTTPVQDWFEKFLKCTIPMICLLIRSNDEKRKPSVAPPSGLGIQ
ncbi:Uncharacterized protein Rs2_03120 [Raphanus sativus]|nr:Uncharacterized protein Rs2_03120 [Raphanus sativus]